MTEFISVYRLITETYKRSDGTFVQSKVLRPQRRLSNFDILNEDYASIGHEAIDSIINLYTVEDGLYYITLVNKSFDYESGHLDGYELMLRTYEKNC